MKNLNAGLTIALILIFQGCAMASSDLIDEIFSKPRPEKFKPVSIDKILSKYVIVGANRIEVKKVLVSQGFRVLEEKMTKHPDDCADCDEMFVIARYDRRPFFSPIYDYGIAIQIGFRRDAAASIHGWYVKNVY